MPGPTAFHGDDIDRSPADVARDLGEGRILLIDIRETYEWDAGRVPGAYHIEIERIASASHSIPADRPVVFICLGGIRSAMVARAFRAAGYDATHVVGGFRAWVADGCPTEPGSTVAPH